MSGGTVHSENTVTVETTAATNLTVENYGMYLITNNIGTQNNAVDWRVSDFQGSTPGGANVPVQPVNPIKMYLPNGYTPTTGNPNAIAPAEPILALSARVVSGANPPAAGQVTRFAVTATVANQTTNAITNVQITVGQQANEANFTTPVSGCIDGVGGPLCPTVGTNACTDSSSAGNYRRCTFTSLAAGSFASMNFEFDFTPPGNRSPEPDWSPAAPLTNSQSSVTYTPASSSNPAGPRTSRARRRSARPASC